MAVYDDITVIIISSAKYFSHFLTNLSGELESDSSLDQMFFEFLRISGRNSSFPTFYLKTFQIA